MTKTSQFVAFVLFAALSVSFGGIGLGTSVRAAENEVRNANVRKKNEGGKSLSAHDRVVGFVRLWSEIKYNFAFFDQVPELDWDKVLEEYLPKLQREQTTKQYYRLLERCVAQLKDGHTSVYLPSDLHNGSQLPFHLAMIEGKVIVTQVAPAARFAHPELKTGQELTHIGGRPVAEILEQHIYPYVADSTRQNRDRHALQRLIKGDEATKAIIGLRDPGGNSRDLTMPYLNWRFPKTSMFECLHLGEDVTYISLNSFSSKDIISQFDAVFDRIRKSKALIVDVRNNGGGSSNIGYAIIGSLINRPLKGSRWKTRQYMPAYRAWGEEERWYNGKPSAINPRTKTPFLGPIAVLIGPSTVSAAEDFVVALHAGGRAILVGEKTAGTTGQPLFIKLPGEGKARICAKRDSYPDGREFVGIGVIPDVEIHPTQTSIASGRDPVLEKALATSADRAGLHKGLLIEQFTREQGRKLAEREDEAKLKGILKRAKVAYTALSVAYAKKDWSAVDRYGNDLSDVFKKEFLPVFELDRHRERIQTNGEMNEQVEYDFHMAELLKNEIESFFRNGEDMAATHRLFMEIEDLSDEVHDCARDGEFEELPKHFSTLRRTWPLFWKRVVAKAPDLER
jgi:C-terminal processing protease CtpA/Prc